nr:unnamed protein product [Callosobruchus chinensis]
MFLNRLVFFFACHHLWDFVFSEQSPNYFLSEAKSVPRIGRSNKGSSDFEKFFLKASKSVPRIGRRNENTHVEEEGSDKDLHGKIRYPTWSEIAERYEYDPELFQNPLNLMKLEEEMGDDPSVYNWEKVRLKRKAPSPLQVKIKKGLRK